MLKRFKSRIEQMKSCDNNGFTLVELLVAIVILAVVVFPTMEVFVSSTKTNSKSRTELQATVTANSVLESAKAFSIYNFDNQCRTCTASNPNSFSLMAGDSQGHKFTSTEYGGKVGVVDLTGNVVGDITQGGSFVEANVTRCYVIYGVRQSHNKYDAVVVISPENYQQIDVDGDKTFDQSQVNGALGGLYNREYKISVYVYKHHDDINDLKGITLGAGDKFITSITGSKFDSGKAPITK